MSSEDLRALLALQDLDSRADQELHRKAVLPERAALAAIEKSLAQLNLARTPLAAQLAEVSSRQELAEKELAATEERVAQVNTRLYGGTVSASRELQAMAADVDGLKKRVSDLEDRALALMDQRQPLDDEVNKIDTEVAALQSQRQGLLAAVAVAEADIDVVLGKLSSERPALAAAVPAAMVATYDRLRQRLGGVAVARLVGGHCDGCHLALPAAELDRIRHHEAGALEYCDQCGRVLVVPAG